MTAIALCLLLAGCSDPAGGGRKAAATPSASPTLGNTLADVERFAHVKAPPDATASRVWATRDQEGPVYIARFTTTEAAAQEFCARNGLGGALPWIKPVDRELRERFHIEGKSAKPLRNCESSSPQNMRVQRVVLVTFTAQGQAVVHLHAFLMPKR